MTYFKITSMPYKKGVKIKISYLVESQIRGGDSKNLFCLRYYIYILARVVET